MGWRSWSRARPSRAAGASIRGVMPSPNERRQRVLSRNRGRGGARGIHGRPGVGAPATVGRGPRDPARHRHRSRRAGLRGTRQVPRRLLEPRARHAVLLRGLRDRLRKDSRRSAETRRPWLGAVARPCLLAGRPAHITGLVLTLLFAGTALATTAIGTLIPVLSDAGELRTRF